MGEIHELFVLALSFVWFSGATPERGTITLHSCCQVVRIGNAYHPTTNDDFPYLICCDPELAIELALPLPFLFLQNGFRITATLLAARLACHFSSIVFPVEFSWAANLQSASPLPLFVLETSLPGALYREFREFMRILMTFLGKISKNPS